MGDDVFYTLLVVGCLSLLGFLGDRMFQKTGFPDVLLLLVVGTLLGPVLGLVDARNLSLITPYFGTLALIFILFDGGLELDFNIILRQFLPVLVLVVLSIGTVMAGVALTLIHLYDWHWLPAWLLASFMANTSGAIVLPVVNRLAIKEDDKTVLKLEAAASDVLVILIFVTLMSLLQAMGTDGGAATFDPRQTLGKLAGSFSIAIVLGILSGTAWLLVLNRIYRHAHNYMATLGMLLILFGISEFLGASGMMAILFFGIVLANSGKFGQFFNVTEIHFTPYELRHLHTTFSFLVRTFFLIYIGFFLSADMFETGFLQLGLIIIAILVAGRFVTTLLFGAIFRKDKATRWAVFAMLPRGLAVAALAAAPGQAVHQMTAARMDAIATARAAHDQAAAALSENRQAKSAAQEKNDVAEVERLTKEEIALNADLQIHGREIVKHEKTLKTLSDIKANTDSFILFASLSILVTNVFMTIACVFVRRAAGGSSPAADIPPAAPPSSL